ncbi:hypothetical protein EBT16_13720, partial [bacterium]|nr:hypothetical protein [bacterium]
MSRSRSKAKMKVIPGGKQLSLIKDTEEILKFLEFTAKTGSEDPSVIDARLKACQWCFPFINEEEDLVGWIQENLNLILSRQTEVSGAQLDSIAQLILDALSDYRFWCSDPFGWERKQALPNQRNGAQTNSPSKKAGRTLTFPVRADVCVEVKVPEGGISTEDFLRLGLFLYP